MAKKTTKKPVKKSKVAAKKAAPRKSKSKEPSLGRPLVTNEEKLYMLFKEDYHARQIFEFLRVETVKDLEEFSPEQIVRLLSRPFAPRSIASARNWLRRIGTSWKMSSMQRRGKKSIRRDELRFTFAF